MIQPINEINNSNLRLSLAINLMGELTQLKSRVKMFPDSIIVQNLYKDTTKMTLLFGFNQIFSNILTSLKVV